MLSFVLLTALSLLCFLASAMLVSYALWYWENQKVLDLTRHIKASNSTTSILEKGMGKRGFSTFDLSSSINRSRTLAKTIVSGTVTGVQGFAKGVQQSGIIGAVTSSTKKAVSGFTSGISTLIKPVPTTSQEEVVPELSQKEIKEQMYQEDVEKMIDETVYEEPKKATLDMASGAGKPPSEDLNLFEKLELRILNRLKESGMTNYDVWLELGSLYKKFGQNDKAKEVFALVLKHAADQSKERARNELIGLS